MSKNLLLFSLGPVQSFIAQARKTHDLYAGSLLLSDLVKAAIEVVEEKNVIFPASGEAMPNRFVAWVPEGETDFKDFGERLEKAVQRKWVTIANNALKDIPEKPAGFEQQIAQHLEIFWVIEPNVTDYKSAIEKLEKQLAALKNVRSFEQFSWQNPVVGERGRKCSLDGQRNVQFYRIPADKKNFDETSAPLYAQRGSVYCNKNFPFAVLQPGEGLSAVSFVKRRYQHEKTEAFKSTAEIALLDALNFLSDPKKSIEGCIRLHEYKNDFEGGWNAQLFFEEGLSEKFLDAQGIRVKRDLTDLRRLRKKCLEDLAKANGYKFQKYYAILTFDGDDMGEWLSGKYLSAGQELERFQQEFAKKLADFATAAKKRLDEGSGQTAYAGGDDFVGFVNLNYLLPVLRDLRQLFREKVDQQLSSFKNKEITFSAGVCVAHYKEPLSLVLQTAREAQKAAKDLPEKNAFAISVIKGSGDDHQTVLAFGENEENVICFQKLVDRLLSGNFSNNFIKTLRLEFDRLFHEEDSFVSQLSEMFGGELARLLHRAAKQGTDKDSTISKPLAKELMDKLYRKKPENFLQALHIADFFQREMDESKKTSNLQLEPQTI